MNKPIKVRELLELCKEQVAKGNGNKSIMISNDDEGNGYHYLWFGFATGEEMQEDDMFVMSVEEDIAPIENTMILG